MFKDLPEVTWPPSLQELPDPNRCPPQSLYTFLGSLMDRGAVPPNNLTCLVDSFAQDIMFVVTRGKHMQQKHFLLGQGLHNLTGSTNRAHHRI